MKQTDKWSRMMPSATAEKTTKGYKHSELQRELDAMTAYKCCYHKKQTFCHNTRVNVRNFLTP
eukprot:4808099-Amphidinium_carterae.1